MDARKGNDEGHNASASGAASEDAAKAEADGAERSDLIGNKKNEREKIMVNTSKAVWYIEKKKAEVPCEK